MTKQEKINYDRYAAADLEKEFYETVAKAPEGIRDAVDMHALANSWTVEVYHEYSSDVERWETAIATALMVIDAPAEYGL